MPALAVSAVNPKPAALIKQTFRYFLETISDLSERGIYNFAPFPHAFSDELRKMRVLDAVVPGHRL